MNDAPAEGRNDATEAAADAPAAAADATATDIVKRLRNRSLIGIEPRD